MHDLQDLFAETIRGERAADEINDKLLKGQSAVRAQAVARFAEILRAEATNVTVEPFHDVGQEPDSPATKPIRREP